MVKSLLLDQSSTALSGLSVVIPCYKEKEDVVEGLWKELSGYGAEVIVVDDGGSMDLEIPHISHTPNMGYGYALKRGIEKATNEVVCTMDGDGQHLVIDVLKLWTAFRLIDDCKMLVGCRWSLKEKPLRWVGRKIINFFATCWARHLLVDLNSGMRLINRRLCLGYFPILCETFSFTTSLTMCMVTDNHRVDWWPIDVKPRVYGKSRVKVIKDGFVTLFFIFYIGFALRTRNLRKWLSGRSE